MFLLFLLESRENQSFDPTPKTLSSVVDHRGIDKISSHSFKIGITTMLAQLGFSEKDIMAIGLWSSSSFEIYLRSPISVRANTTKRMTEATYKKRSKEERDSS